MDSSFISTGPGGLWFDPPARTIFFPRIDDSNCHMIYSSLTVVLYFYDGYVGKQPVSWKEYSAEYRKACIGLLAAEIYRIYSSLSCPLFVRWLCGKSASVLKRILCRIEIKRTPGKHVEVHRPPRYN